MPKLREQIIPRRKLMLMASESVIFTAVLFLGTSVAAIRSEWVDFELFSIDTLRGLLSSFTIGLLCQVSLSYNDLYDWRVSQNRAELLHRLLHSAGYALVMVAGLVLLVPWLFQFSGVSDMSIHTWKLIALVLFAFLVVYAWRAGFHWFFFKWNFGERVLILGSGENATDIEALIEEHGMAGFEVAGVVESLPKRAASSRKAGSSNGAGGMEPISVLVELAARHGAARVIVALEERRGQLPVEELLACRMAGITVEETEAMYERLTGKMAVTSLRPSYLIFGTGFVKHPVAGAIKRVIDIVASLLGLITSAPICLIAIILIKLDSRGPVLFRQERVGQDGELFSVMKFRTMTVDAEAKSGPVWAGKNDARVTRIGKFLRITRIDEIPQMLNVLTGHMSFVGPRPERPFFVEQLAERSPYYMLRHTVKPGLTGWAQVMAPYGASFDDAIEKLRFDLYYIKNLSPFFDLNIILRTVGVVMFGKGAR